MESTLEIFEMLDWNKSEEAQARGRLLAEASVDVSILIQPTLPQYNKNIWENCAIIIAQKSDEELEAYVVELLEWLKDMNKVGQRQVWRT